MRTFASPWAGAPERGLDLARVLVVHGELAPRLALRTLLQAGGYAVEVAGSAAEATAKLDDGRFELVLSDALLGSHQDSENILAYARMKDYHPATAMIISNDSSEDLLSSEEHEVAIRTEDVPMLLGKVADLIGMRVSRRSRLMSRPV